MVQIHSSRPLHTYVSGRSPGPMRVLPKSTVSLRSIGPKATRLSDRIQSSKALRFARGSFPLFQASGPG